MKVTKTFKALDRSQMDAMVTAWLKTLPGSPKLVKADHDTIMGMVKVHTAKGPKNRKMPMRRLKLTYEFDESN